MNYKRHQIFFIVSILIITATVIFALFNFRFFYHDDETITLRYVRNFLQHGQLTWNLGERVEGYTNFLHLIFSSLFVLFTHDYLLSPRIVNFIFFAILVVSSIRLIRKRVDENDKDNNILILVFLAIAITYPGMVIWSYGGLETVLFAVLVFLGVSTVLYCNNSISNSVLAGILFTMAAMTRPDGLFFLMFSGLYLLVTGIRARNIKPFLTLALVFAVLYGCYFLIRYSYYGQLLPNTFYAKTNFNSTKLQFGIRYTLRFASSILLIVVLAVVLIASAFFRKTLNLKTLFLLGIIAFYTLYIITYGGDHMLAFRFFIPLVPIIALTVVELTRNLSFNFKQWVLAVCLLHIALVYGRNQIEFRNATTTDPAAFNGAIVGNYLNTALPDNQLIATNSAGAVPFYGSKHRFIDMLGLCDTTISHRNDIPKLAPWQAIPGHEKGDGKYVLRRQPDIIILGPAQGTGDKPWFLSDAEMLQDSTFKKDYVKEVVQLSTKQLNLGSVVKFKQSADSDSLSFVYYKRIKR